jgi:hypothetical protein
MEELHSNFADTNDDHASPKIFTTGKSTDGRKRANPARY